jgi:hypothetical protein
MMGVKRWVSYAAVLAVLVSLPQVWAAEAAKADAPKPATSQAGPKDLLEAIPDDAWGFVAIPNLKTFDGKLGDLGEKLNFPIGSPIALAMGQLGIAEGLREDGGVGLVVMDPTQYGTPPDDLVILLPTTDAKALLTAFNPQDAGEGLQKIDIMGKSLVVMPKGGFVVIGLEKNSVKTVGEAKKGIRASLKPENLERYSKADIYAMVNLRPAIEMAKPLAGQVVAMLMMGAMDGDPEAAERIQKTAQDVVSLLDELTTLEITLGLDDVGLSAGFILSFNDGSITKKIASIKTSPVPMLAGLPKDGYMLAMAVRGSEPSEGTLQQGILDLLMSRPEVNKVIDKAKMAEITKLGKALRANLRDYGVTVSLLPEGADGKIGLTAVIQSTDVKATMENIKKLVEGYKGLAKDETAKKALDEGLVYKAAAEKVGDVSVDQIAMDLSKIPGIDSGIIESINKVIGKDGALIRIAPAGDKSVVMTLGGGAKRFEEVLKIATPGGCPLSEDVGIAKIRKKMPKTRLFELYVSADRILKVVKAVTGSDQVPVMPEINAPLGVSLAAEKNYGRLDIILPIELIVEIKNIALQVIMGGGFGGGGGAAGGAEKKPAPSF